MSEVVSVADRDDSPSGWRWAPIGQLAEEVSERAGRHQELPVLSVTKHQGIVRADDYFKKAVHGRDTSKYKIVRRGHFAYATIHLDEGSIGVLSRESAGIVSPMYTVFRTQAGIDSTYLLALLKLPTTLGVYKRLAEGTVNRRASISFESLSTLRLLLPPLAEQRKIAAILSSVDDAIEATQAVIDQLQVVKKAMMAELLTRGLPGRHTRFKMTEIGEIPEEWEVVTLDSVARRGSGHTPSKSHPEYWNGDIKWISLKDSSALDRLYITDTVAKITPLGIANSSAVEYPTGTVVLSRDAAVGKSAITTAEMAVSQHFMAWRCGEGLNNHFLYYLLQHWKPRFEHIAIGNTIKTIGLPFFKALRIPVPRRDEQDPIAKALTTIDLRIFAEANTVVGIRKVKSALMSVLLTGEVRVKPDEGAPA
jgi:type I restriction enzyme S subunit